MSDNLLRDAMIVEARKWLDDHFGYALYPRSTAEMVADFCLHMTGSEAPGLRYVKKSGESTSYRNGGLYPTSSTERWEDEGNHDDTPTR